MALDNATIQQRIIEHFGEAVHSFEEPYGMLTFTADRNKVIELLSFLRDDATLRFNFLTDLTGIHYPDNDIESQFAVVYQLHNWIDNVRIRFKCFLNGHTPEIHSATDVFLCTNWIEREAYDFFGINFLGHPDLKRILNMDEMVSFPMRKEFPLEDGSRTDKDDRYFGRTPLNANNN